MGPGFSIVILYKVTIRRSCSAEGTVHEAVEGIVGRMTGLLMTASPAPEESLFGYNHTSFPQRLSLTDSLSLVPSHPSLPLQEQ